MDRCPVMFFTLHIHEKRDENPWTSLTIRFPFKQIWKSLYCRSRSMEIDKKRCIVVFSVQKSMKIVVLSFKIDGIRYIFYQKQPFRCGGPPKSRKNVKRKHNFCKFGAPLSHFRPLCRIFWFNCSCYLLVLAISCYHLFLPVLICVAS